MAHVPLRDAGAIMRNLQQGVEHILAQTDMIQLKFLVSYIGGQALREFEEYSTQKEADIQTQDMTNDELSRVFREKTVELREIQDILVQNLSNHEACIEYQEKCIEEIARLRADLSQAVSHNQDFVDRLESYERQYFNLKALYDQQIFDHDKMRQRLDRYNIQNSALNQKNSELMAKNKSLSDTIKGMTSRNELGVKLTKRLSTSKD